MFYAQPVQSYQGENWNKTRETEKKEKKEVELTKKEDTGKSEFLAVGVDGYILTYCRL